MKGKRPSQQELLRRHGVRPVKRRGQNFLIDGNMARAIATDITSFGMDVLELGAGGGAVTFPLLEAGARVTAVEVDRGLCAILREETAGEARFRLLEADIAALDWEVALAAAGERPVLAGNLPYVLTSEVLFALADWRDRVAGAIFMVQLEVARRLASSPGGREYGVLSVLLGALFRIEVVRQVPPAVFWPRPDVMSAVVSLAPRAGSWPDDEYRRFKALVKKLFQQRRKQMGKILRQLYGVPEAASDGWLARAGIDPGDRPEHISRGALRMLAAAVPEVEEA
ncbi:ribosomal RNA small subunit methyltransferase A [bacterium]|nr:ribosomal RNA small subunit methyltransferase A [bacterium]MBU1073114.1 ribosomal RNA small subunit methyltransferase A [bacterium]MBU1675931.1 ribosomal RNA small subunit methyltransferase A [bacterium]